jgi:hypothetical protein
VRRAQHNGVRLRIKGVVQVHVRRPHKLQAVGAGGAVVAGWIRVLAANRGGRAVVQVLNNSGGVAWRLNRRRGQRTSRTIGSLGCPSDCNINTEINRIIMK